jgi:WD40 repeat protein
MKSILPSIVTIVALLMMGFVVGQLEAAEADEASKSAISFHKQIMPILKKSCTGCHHPGKLKGKLDMTSVAKLLKGGETGPGFVAGNPKKSLLVEQISGPKPEMPSKGKPLTKDQVALIELWVKQGAKDDTPIGLGVRTKAPDLYSAAPKVTAIAYSPDGKLLAVSGYHEIVLHRADGSKIEARLMGQSARIESMVFSADGKYLAAAGGAPARFGQIQIWDVAARKLHREYKVSADSLYGVSISPDGKKIAFGCTDKTARVIQIEDGKELLRFRAHADWVLGTCFTKDGKTLVTAGRDKAMKLIDLGNGRFIDDINNPLERAFSFARSPNGGTVMYGGDLGTARIYKISDNQKRTAGRKDTNLVRAFEKQPGVVHALAFSPDGSLIALGSPGPEVRVYQVKDGKRVKTFTGHKGAIYGVVFSPDGKQLAAGGFDGKVRLYDVVTGKMTKEFWPVPLKDAKTASAK